MSYNIDTFKVKELELFIVPVESLYKHKDEDWHLSRVNNDDGTVTFSDGATEIHGNIQDDFLFVSGIECSGEGSGSVMNRVIEPAFKDSTGRLVASCVWEGGDCVNRLIVDKGEVTWEDIEI